MNEVEHFAIKELDPMVYAICLNNNAFDIFGKDVKTLCKENKHMEQKTYDNIFKHIFLHDERIISIISGNKYKFKYKAIGLFDLSTLINDVTGISIGKIRNILINSKKFEFILKNDIGNLRLIRANMTFSEEQTFNKKLFTKYEIYQKTMGDDLIE